MPSQPEEEDASGFAGDEEIEHRTSVAYSALMSDDVNVNEEEPRDVKEKSEEISEESDIIIQAPRRQRSQKARKKARTTAMQVDDLEEGVAPSSTLSSPPSSAEKPQPHPTHPQPPTSSKPSVSSYLPIGVLSIKSSADVSKSTSSSPSTSPFSSAASSSHHLALPPPHTACFKQPLSDQSDSDIEDWGHPGTKGCAAEDIFIWDSAHKERYYQKKFGFTGLMSSHEVTAARHRITLEYLRGLSWVLKYYYQVSFSPSSRVFVERK